MQDKYDEALEGDTILDKNAKLDEMNDPAYEA